MTETRRRAIDAVRAQLEQQASPRLHMSALVAATSAAGLIASWAMLHAGLTSMTVRYPLAVAAAYLVFLGLVGLWLRRFRLRRRQRDNAARLVDGAVDLIEIPIGDLLRPSAPTPTFEGFGHGGGFSGGGSSATWDDAAPASASSLRVASVLPSRAPQGGSSSGGGGVSVPDLDLDDAWWLVVVAVIAVLVLSVAVYVVYVAPMLFAELLLDAGLAAGLYGRLSRGEPRAWLLTAVRGTIIPATLAAILLGLAGAAMGRVAPGATSIGRVVERLLHTDGTARPPASAAAPATPAATR